VCLTYSSLSSLVRNLAFTIFATLVFLNFLITF